MFANDLIVSFALIAILFLRQIAILKHENKINYAPLMIGIGLISSIIHFIIHPEFQNSVLLLRESLFPILVSLFLYLIMNVMHQTQESEYSKSKDTDTIEMMQEVRALKEFMGELEERMKLYQLEDRKAQDDIRLKFIEDIKSLEQIKVNQIIFIDKFDEMEIWHKQVSKEFHNFTNIEIPKLDNIINKHIGILRIAEQDHFNKIQIILDKAVNSRGKIAENIDNVKNTLHGIQNMSDSIAKSITTTTVKQLQSVTKSFEDEITSLKTQSQMIQTTLKESEGTLVGIGDKSEMIMKQMVLSSNKMNELEGQNTGLHDVYTTIKKLMLDMETIKADYIKSQAHLSVISSDLKANESEQVDTMKKQIEKLSEVLTNNIEDSLNKLHEHYHISDEDMNQSVQVLAKKAQLQMDGYGKFDT